MDPNPAGFGFDYTDTPIKMNIYTCTKFTGHYPTGVAAIVTAESPSAAAAILNSELQMRFLVGDARPEDMKPYPNRDPRDCRILADGNY